MATRTWQALVLGKLPEARDMFARPLFEEELPTDVIHVAKPEAFDNALEEHPSPDVILIDADPHGLEILKKVRERFPVSPLVMVGEPDKPDVVIKALQKGLERHVMRLEDSEQFTTMLSQVVYQVLQQTLEPPSMETPSAEQMHRYAQYHHILHPFFVVGQDGRLLYVNAAGERLIWKLVGRSPVIGEILVDELLDGLGAAFARQLDEALEGEESVMQHRFDKLETPQDRNVHCMPLPTSSGRTIAASISVHQEIPPEIERTKTMRAISRFAGGLAHDFNNLLNVVMVQNELMRAYMGEVAEPVEKCLQSVGRAVAQGSDLTRQLLSISHETLAYRAAIGINRLIEALDPELRALLRGSQTLEMKLADAVPPVQADPKQIEQLISHLVENAADAMGEEGSISICTDVVRPSDGESAPRGLESRRWVVISIEDTGPGVRPALHSRIFEPFFTTQRAQGHSGLGLTLVHAVVEQLGGRIFVDSEPGEGTAFTIYLPAGDPADVPSKQTQPFAPQAKQPARTTILLVEDEDDLRMPFREALARRGFDVLAARDVPSALELIEEQGEEIAAVISDVIMPGGSGIDLVRELVELHPEVKVVFVSGHTVDVIEDADSELNFDYTFLAKPISLDQLVEVVDLLFDEGHDH